MADSSPNTAEIRASVAFLASHPARSGDDFADAMAHFDWLLEDTERAPAFAALTLRLPSLLAALCDALDEARAERDREVVINRCSEDTKIRLATELLEARREIAAFQGRPEGAISPEWESLLMGNGRRLWTRDVDGGRSLRVEVHDGVVVRIVGVEHGPAGPFAWSDMPAEPVTPRLAMRAAEAAARARGWLPPKETTKEGEKT